MSDLVLGLARTLGDVVAPLRIGLTNRQELEALLFRNGWDVDIPDADLGNVLAAFGVEALVEALLTELDDAINGSPADQVAASLAALDAAKALVQHISDLTSAGVGALLAPFDQSVFWSELSTSLFPDLLSAYLMEQRSSLFAVLRFAGIIRFVSETPSGVHRVDFVRTEIDWDQLAAIATRPSEAFNDRYAWNLAGQSFRHLDLLRVIEGAMLALGVPAAIGPPRPSLAGFVDDAGVTAGELMELEVPVIEGVGASDRAYWKLGMVMLPVAQPVGSADAPTGLLVAPLLDGDTSTEVYLSRNVWLRFIAGIDADLSFRVLAYPGQLSIDADPSLTALDVGVELIGAPDEPWILLGSPETSRVELDGFRIEYSLRGPATAPESVLFAGTTARVDVSDGLRLVVDLSDLGFLGSAADAAQLVLGADVGVVWSNRTGFTFNGSIGFDFELPANLAIGPLSIDRVLGGLRVTAESVAAELAASVGMAIGPVALRFDRLGLRVGLNTTDGGDGFFGAVSPEFDLLPPTGLSITLDAGAVTGSGFLDIDRPNHRYTGSLDIAVSEFRVAAFGMLQTHLPAQGPEYSLLIVLAAEFPGLQVGFGITLNGISGLVGIHRGAAAKQLRQELTSGTIGNLLTLDGAADDPTGFLTSMNSIFPVRPGRHLLGIGVQLRWIELVRLDLMIAIELPGPAKIILLGSVRAELEAAGRQLLRLRLDVLGILDFEKKLLSIDAALVDSSLLDVLAIEGGAAIRMSWGAQPYLVMSVGGFHPDFVPEPAVLPVPRRVGMSAGKPDGLIYYRLDGYFAITPNTLQFGASAEIRVNAGPLKARGSLGFDVLVQFDPFRFKFDFRARFRVSLEGVTLAGASVKGTLSGPGPMVFRGKVCIEILFFSACWSGSVKLGSSVSQPAITVTSVAEELRREITATNLSAAPNRRPSTSVELGTDASGRPVIAPDGSLTWTQTRVPFGLPLDKFEGSPLARPVVLRTNSGSGMVDEWFAPAGFADYGDAEAINLPAFERLPGGVDLSGAAPATGDPRELTVEIDEIILPDIVRPRLTMFMLPTWLFATPPPVVPLIGVMAERWDVVEADATPVMTQGRAVSQHWARATGAVAVSAGDTVEVAGL